MKKMVSVGKYAILLVALVLIGSVGSALAQSIERSGESLSLNNDEILFKITVNFVEREKDGKKWRENCNAIVQLTNKHDGKVVTEWFRKFKYQEKPEGSTQTRETSGRRKLFYNETLTESFSNVCYLRMSDMEIRAQKVIDDAEKE